MLSQNYPTNFAWTNCSIPPFQLNKSKYRISIWGPNFWKNVSTDTEESNERPISLKPKWKIITYAGKRTYIFLSISKFTTAIYATGTWWQDLHVLNVVLYILAFVYCTFHEATLFFIVCISSKWEKLKKKKRYVQAYTFTIKVHLHYNFLKSFLIM